MNDQNYLLQFELLVIRNGQYSRFASGAARDDSVVSVGG